MRNLIIILVLMFSAVSVDAQINTKVKRDFTVKVNEVNDQFKCISGDIVTIHAFKNKNDKYFFTVSTKDFATIISFSDIPFEADEKMLKKLPNALSSKSESFVKTKNEEILAGKKKQRKQEALDGKIKYIVPSDLMFIRGEGASGSLSKNDTVYILGYNKFEGAHQFALYSDNASGIFEAFVSDDFIKDNIDTKYLPPLTDTDVRIILNQKAIAVKQKIEIQKEQYKQKALEGNIKAVVAKRFYYDDTNPSLIFLGDTVSVLGYSFKDDKHYYALSSIKECGIFNGSSPIFAFQNSTKVTTYLLPPVDSPEVSEALEKEKIKQRKKRDKMNLYLIQNYKKESPIIIENITWSSDYVGGLKVNIKLVNCSQQTIKYITFNGFFENAVGDKCRNEIGGGTTWTARGIGPVGPAPLSLDNFNEKLRGCHATFDFDDPTFYSKVAESFVLSSVTIQYMNGASVKISGENLESHIK